MVLEFFVGHTGSVTVDDAKVGCRDFLGGGVAVGRRCIDHKALTRGIPFLRLVLLLCNLLLDVIELLALDFVLVLGLLNGVGDASGKGLEKVGGIHWEEGRNLKARQDAIAVEAGIPLHEFSVIWGGGEMPHQR